MKRQFKFATFLLLSASLFYGFAARAQGVQQSERVSYALSLIDANTQGAVNDSTTDVCVKVTVSVPRAEGSSNYGSELPVYASPARLMFRQHRGPSTAFDGTLTLTREAPYAADGVTSVTNAYYPMPQKDPENLNLIAVQSGATQNLAGNDYASYVGLGQAHDMARWEATYLTKSFSIDEIKNGTAANHLMLKSLLNGNATYEWFVASRRGVGSVARISDIQDHGRNMAFTDLRLWTPQGAESTAIDASSKRTLGKYEEYTLASMPGEYSWKIFRGTIGSNSGGDAGAQLLNAMGTKADKSDAPRIESPIYPDGISSVTFDACTSSEEGIDSKLLVQYKTETTQWTDAETYILKGDFQTITVDFSDRLPPNAKAQFRLVRTTESITGGSANLFTYVVRNLLVRSAKPTATFGDLQVELSDNSPDAEPNAGATFITKIAANAATTNEPRGYIGEFKVRRRANGDTSNAWYKMPATVVYNEGSDNAMLRATFTPGVLVRGDNGSVNVRDNAFFTDANGQVTGVLAGVYDVAVSCGVYGSFEAGRSAIDGYEVTSYDLDSYEGDDGVTRPYILNVREKSAKAASVFLRVMYLTGNSEDNYDLDTFDIPLLPSAMANNVWRVDVEKILRHATESTATYAWGYEAPEDADVESVFEPGYLSFKIFSRDKDGKETWYGQKTTVSSETVRPPLVEVVPAISETLAKAANEASAIPVVVATETLPNSHLMVELNLADSEMPIASLSGSFWQDFNTWDISTSFGATEFRENVTSVTADFDSKIVVENGETKLVGGWKPDEGPLADTTSFTESLLTGRLGQSGYSFILPTCESIEKYNEFASWGAASKAANPNYLRADADLNSIYSEHLMMDDAEVVLRRSFTHSGDISHPDSLFRLRGEGSSLSPKPTSEVNGIGKVSFRLSLSLPYDINSIAELISTKEDDITALDASGFTASVALSNPSQTAAPSGYSVSYYLTDYYTTPRSPTTYELRVSQVMQFDDTDRSEEPDQVVVMELYQHANGIITRLQLQDGNKTKDYHVVNRGTQPALAGKTYGLWVRKDGSIALAYNGGSNSDTLNVVATSAAGVIKNVDTKFSFAFGSAECRPVFRQINRIVNSIDANISSASGTAIAAGDAEILASIGGTLPWTLSTDSTTGGRIQISRNTPNAYEEGSVEVIAYDNVTGQETHKQTCRVSGMDQRFEMTIGATNARLVIKPLGNSNVLIDDITVTSWCGNDANRNGSYNVPLYTDEGFVSDEGFAAVGVWIRPEEDGQLTASPRAYTGKQCLLMQRSRQNRDNGSEVTTGDVTHTGNAMAIYLPYSQRGYGPVSFRYRIPQTDEYGGQGTLPSVRVMLQYIDDGYYSSFLKDGTNRIPDETAWTNVSAPVELRNTGGEWSMASITPKLNGKELVGENGSGTLRLVMVISKDMSKTDDRYVYIDDLRVTDNKSGTTASWTAKNVRVTETPISNLYWKDRLPTEGGTFIEETFAEKSTLTRAMQFNSVTTDAETEGSYATTVIESPILANGVGRVTFAARVTTPQTNPVRLYICATTDDSENKENLKTVTYVDVESTVYKSYDIDLSKIKFYGTAFNAEGEIVREGTTAFNCAAIRRLTIKALVDGDGVTTDDFGLTPVYGRVLIDQLAIANPVLPSIRVASVAFSNMPGEDTPSEFDAHSPLSQPVSGTAKLRAMVHLDRAQLLKMDSIRVFLTLDPHGLGVTGSSLQSFESGYWYQDVLGGTVEASSDHPIYTWNPTSLETWPLSAWFNSEAVLTALTPSLNATNAVKLDTEALKNLKITNTIELEKASNSDQLYFYGDLSEMWKELSLSENSLVRYNAWAVYQSEDAGDQWFITQISPANYTEFPWYFPRSLNAELREKASTVDDVKTAAFFSPYFWVYSYLPGEAFINEINIEDSDGAVASSASTYRFVEICAPANTNLAGWRIEMTADSVLSSISNGSISIKPGTDVLPEPNLGVVPYQRKDATNAERAFYTAFNENAKIYYYDDTEKRVDLPTTNNAGVATRDYVYNALYTGRYDASSIRLHRPTGGAEHIVCFSSAKEANIGSTATKNLNKIYTTYSDAYTEKGFGGEWMQTFTTGSWADYVSEKTAADAFGELAILNTIADEDERLQAQVKMHARRLVKAETFPADTTTDENRFSVNATKTAVVNDSAETNYSNSIATVDMGGIFVTRKDAINVDVENGPLDLTQLMTDKWDATKNLTKQTRVMEPIGGKADVSSVVQVTPRQINPDQFLVLYSGFAASSVTSKLNGNYGTHTLETFDEDQNPVRVNRGGMSTPNTWAVSQKEVSTKLTYSALLAHYVTEVKFRMQDASDAKSHITDLDKLRALVSIDGITFDADAVDAEGWVTISVPEQEAVTITATMAGKTAGGEEIRYSLEAEATFARDPNGGLARQVITSVAPYCGTVVPGSAQYQPWWGSDFGFEVKYDEAILNGAAKLDGVIVTYPSPAANVNQAWGLGADWTGANTLEGMEYATAIETLKTTLMPNNGTRFVELRGGNSGVFLDASAISAPGEAYAKANGYDGTAVTAMNKEPAIPFCVWGIYTVTIPTERGNSKLSFLMRQAMPAEKDTVWTYPAHYAPIANKNGTSAETSIPYFYLYSTPSQSAWLNEVNLWKADGDAEPSAEVVFPVLRDGILSDENPTVKQAEPAGWTIKRYDATGALAETKEITAANKGKRASASYDYYVVTIDQNDAQSAYVLHRPCGAAEGGVWTATSDNGGDAVSAPAVTNNAWLVPPETSFVVPGVADAKNVAGSVQLTSSSSYISSVITERTQWVFAATSLNGHNEGKIPDVSPVWNQVTVTSTLRNTVYAGSTCGYQMIPGVFDGTNKGETAPVSLTLGGGAWEYNDQLDGLVLSYRPSTGYRFETMTLPAGLIGKVILVGQRDALNRATILTKVTELKAAAALDPTKKTSDWLTLEGCATLEMQEIDGAEVPTGKILFNPDAVIGQDSDGEPITLGDSDTFIVSLVFVESPSSAQNSIEVAFGQGEVKLGAWMISQTFYALTQDATNALVPDFAKGGDTTVKPIWSDEEGNVDGDYANVHGWIYQPLAGDRMGMSVVINPELGLKSSRFEDPVASLSDDNATLRPFLVWTVTPKNRVPPNLFDGSQSGTASSGMTRQTFIQNWSVDKWVGNASLQDGTFFSLSELRSRLRRETAAPASSSLCAAAGIIPMTYLGSCDKDRNLAKDIAEDMQADENLLAFRTMNAAELQEALNNKVGGITNEGTGAEDANPLLPYTSEIDMVDTNIWKDGAIIRFAVIIADATTGWVYDCQSISNFTSDALEAYCPWYIPDATTNVNRVTSTAEAGGGVSPFAWVYEIPQGGVWINEFRPFSEARADNTRAASAFELAMYASPLVEDSAIANGESPKTFTPTRTLDGWKVITRYAPMPSIPVNGDPTEELAPIDIEWTTHKEVPLYSWVPYRRVVKTQIDAGTPPEAFQNVSYDLDYYTATVDSKLDPTVSLDATLSIANKFYRAARYWDDLSVAQPQALPTTFQWLNFDLTNADMLHDTDLFNADLITELKKDATFTNGVMLSIALVRNNGAIEDAVIFSASNEYMWSERLDFAVKCEVANKTTAGVVRKVSSLLNKGTTQFVKATNHLSGTADLMWFVSSNMDTPYKTYTSPNFIENSDLAALGYVFEQPYREYDAINSELAEIEASLTGCGAAYLYLKNGGVEETGPEVALTAAYGSNYILKLCDWKQSWHKLESATCNGVEIQPTWATTYSTTGTTNEVQIANEVVTKSVKYNLVFTYTDEAQTLAAEMTSDDPAFYAWLEQADPADITPAAQGGATAAERYWLGADTPTEDMDPSLGFAFIGTIEETVENVVSAKPLVSVELTDGAQRVTTLVGDGRVALYGAETLDGEWTFLKVLQSNELLAEGQTAEATTIQLNTTCKFFFAKLIAEDEIPTTETTP